GVQAEKTGAALERYNDVSRRLQVALACWRRATGRADASMGAALASAPDARERVLSTLGSEHDREYPPASLIERVEQFDTETNDIIPAAGDALTRGDLAALGAFAASAFGAGFGGSVWALVNRDLASEFRDRWAVAYRTEFPEAAPRSEFFTTGAGAAAARLA